MEFRGELNFDLKSIKKHYYKPHTFLHPVALKEDAICFIHYGECMISIDQMIYKVKAGDCLFLKSTMEFQLKTAKEPVQLFYVMYSEKNVEEVKEWNRVTDQLKIRIQSQTTFSNLLIQLELVKKTNLQALLKRQAIFYDLLYLLVVEINSLQVEQNTTINKIIEYMEEHFATIDNSGQLPHMANLTPSSFCRAFKKKTGQTPGTYLTELKMKRAKELLKVSNHSLKEISHSIGYQDPLYFSRVFKKAVGVAPSIYIKNKDTRIAVVSGLMLQDQFLSLGITPIAAPSLPTYFSTKTGYPSYLEKYLKESTPLNIERKIEQQEIAILCPDILFCMDNRLCKYDHLLNHSFDTISVDAQANWKGYQLELANKLKKETVAERIIKQMEQVEERSKSMLRKFSSKGSWTIIRIFNSEIRLYGINGHALSYLFYHDLEFQPNESINHSAYKIISMEELVNLNPERILIIWTEKAEINKLTTSAHWNDLRAVKEFQVYLPDSKEWDPWGPLGREHMLKKSVEYFTQFI